MRAFNRLAVFICFFACCVPAKQSPRIYETLAICAESDGTEYCYVTDDSGTLVVFNYLNDPERILVVHDKYSEFVPVGEKFEKGYVQGNVYQDINDKSTATILVADNEVRILESWNGMNYCSKVILWGKEKKNFNEVYHDFTELPTFDSFEEISDKCMSQQSKRKQ